MAPTALTETQLLSSQSQTHLLASSAGKPTQHKKRPQMSFKALGTADPSYPKLETASVSRDTFAFDAIDDALDAFARGEFLVVMDDENRENEGDLITSAAHITTEKMAWMIKHTRYETHGHRYHAYI